MQKCDKAVQVNPGLCLSMMQRLETVTLGPYGGSLSVVSVIFHSGLCSIKFEPVLTFSLNGNLQKLETYSQ